MARDAGGDRFVERQALFYPPSTHMLDSSPSIYEYGEGGLFLTMDQMRWFGQQYLRDIRDAVDPPRASPPILADLTGLPPALVVTVEYDPPLRIRGRTSPRQ